MTTDPLERFFMERSARLNRRARLKVMNGSEIVDTAVRIYQQLGWTFLKLTVVPTLFVVAAVAFVFQYVLPSFLTTQDSSNLTTQLTEVAVSIGLAVFVGGPLLVIGVSATTAIVAQLVSDYMLGNVPSGDGAVKAAKRTLGTLIRVHFWELLLSSSGLLGAIILSGLSSLIDKSTTNENVIASLIALLAALGFVGGGFVFLIVVSRHALCAPIAVIEGVKPREAAKRSVTLLKGAGVIPSGYGNVWSLYVSLFFLTLFLYSGLTGILSAVGFPGRFESYFDNLPYGGVFIEALGLVPLFIWIWVSVPVWAVTVTIIYYERRIRLEGYDIEALASDVWRNDRQTRFEL